MSIFEGQGLRGKTFGYDGREGAGEFTVRVLYMYACRTQSPPPFVDAISRVQGFLEQTFGYDELGGGRLL